VAILAETEALMTAQAAESDGFYDQQQRHQESLDGDNPTFSIKKIG
jgi:hypothetical protein